MNEQLHHSAAPEISHVAGQIVQMVQPQRIYLYKQRTSASGDTTGFKLCVVGSFESKAAAERDIYLNIDCDVPYDVILYTADEWERLCGRTYSFASRIARMGTVIYG